MSANMTKYYASKKKKITKIVSNFPKIALSILE